MWTKKTINKNNSDSNEIKIGTIIAIHKDWTASFEADNSWAECDGSTVDGYITPNLVGKHLSASVSDIQIVGSATHTHLLKNFNNELMDGGANYYSSTSAYYTSAIYGSHTHTITSDNNDPSYFEVVYFIKIK